MQPRSTKEQSHQKTKTGEKVTFIEDDKFVIIKPKTKWIALDDEKIIGVISVTTLAELLIFLGKDVYKNKLNELLSLNLEIIDADQTIAIMAGELHMIYKLPLGDSLIAATGMNENIKHILTDDGHFDSVQNIIKAVNLKTALRLCGD